MCAVSIHMDVCSVLDCLVLTAQLAHPPKLYRIQLRSALTTDSECCRLPATKSSLGT